MPYWLQRSRMIHSARDLTPEQKRSIESLLGRSLRDDEDLSIRAFPSPPHLPLNSLVKFYLDWTPTSLRQIRNALRLVPPKRMKSLTRRFGPLDRVTGR